MHVGTRQPLWQVIHESLHTRGSGLKPLNPAALIGSDPGRQWGDRSPLTTDSGCG